jgi:hypothetical protein
MAKTLRAELLARAQIDLTHSRCLEIVARQFGVDDWNVLAALMDSAAPSSWRTPFAPATTIPVLRIFSESSAMRFYVEFLGFTLDFGGPSSGGDSPFYSAPRLACLESCKPIGAPAFCPSPLPSATT